MFFSTFCWLWRNLFFSLLHEIYFLTAYFESFLHLRLFVSLLLFVNSILDLLEILFSRKVLYKYSATEFNVAVNLSLKEISWRCRKTKVFIFFFWQESKIEHYNSWNKRNIDKKKNVKYSISSSKFLESSKR